MIVRPALVWTALLLTPALAVPLPHDRPPALAPKASAKPEATPKPKPGGAKSKTDLGTKPKALPAPKPAALEAKPEPEAKQKTEPKQADTGRPPDPAAKAEKEPPRPDERAQPEPAHTPATPETADFGPHPPEPGLVEADVSSEPIPDKLCDELQAAGEIEFERLPRIMDKSGCGALTPVSIKALAPKGGQRVTFENPVTANCGIAKAALTWLTSSVQPAAIKHLGGPITKFRQTGGYECRGRNRVAGAKISEHGSANALDIGGFERANGVVVPVNDKGEAEAAFLAEIRASACGPFTTVLGPGIFAHDTHFHLDLAKRGKDGHTTYCR